MFTYHISIKHTSQQGKTHNKTNYKIALSRPLDIIRTNNIRSSTIEHKNLQNRGDNTDSKKTLKQKEDQMKNTMLLFITILLCAIQPAYSMENTEKTIKSIKKFTFDKAGSLESNKHIDEFPDPKIAERLITIKTFYEINHKKYTIPNIELNTIGHIMLNYPLYKTKKNVNKFTITYTKPKTNHLPYEECGKTFFKYQETTEQKTYTIQIPDKQNP